MPRVEGLCPAPNDSQKPGAAQAVGDFRSQDPGKLPGPVGHSVVKVGTFRGGEGAKPAADPFPL
jgi:hypothetical protein